MMNTGPIFDQATHYRIKVRGRVDAGWLQNYDHTAEIIDDESKMLKDTTVLNVHSDQSGIVGLVRRLHALGITILQFQIVSNE